MLTLITTLGISRPAIAQKIVQIRNQNVEYIFGEQFEFNADLGPITNVSQIQLVFTQEGFSNSTIVPVQFDSNYHLQAIYVFQPQDNIQPFSTISYRYIVTLSSNEQIQSDTFTFDYIDNRKPWKLLEGPNYYQVHWYEGELEFGQSLLDAALNSIEFFKSYLLLPNPEFLDIYVYPSRAQLQEALNITGQPWVAGQATPEMNLVLVSIEPGPLAQLEIDRQIPHEITHVRLYQYLDDRYGNLPIWLNEGIASLAEFYPNPDYRSLLKNANEKDDLLSFNSLCDRFPSNKNETSLAYAQSDSFLRFIHKEYGSVGLQKLVDTYAQGHKCEKGTEEALGLTLTELEKDWRFATFNEVPADEENPLVAWIILCGFALLTPIIAILLSARKKSTSDGQE